MILDRSHSRGLHLWLKCRTGRSRRANLFVSTKCIKQSGQIVTLHRRANKWTQKAQPYLVPSCTPGSAQGDAGSNRKRSSTTFRTKSFEECTLTRRWPTRSSSCMLVLSLSRRPGQRPVRPSLDRVLFVKFRVRGKNIGPTTFRRIVVRYVANLLQISQN